MKKTTLKGAFFPDGTGEVLIEFNPSLSPAQCMFLINHVSEACFRSPKAFLSFEGTLLREISTLLECEALLENPPSQYSADAIAICSADNLEDMILVDFGGARASAGEDEPTACAEKFLRALVSPGKSWPGLSSSSES